MQIAIITITVFLTTIIWLVTLFIGIKIGLTLSINED